MRVIKLNLILSYLKVVQRDRPLLAQCDAEIPQGIFIFGVFICFTVAGLRHLLQTRAGLFSNKRVCGHSGVALVMHLLRRIALSGPAARVELVLVLLKRASF